MSTPPLTSAAISLRILAIVRAKLEAIQRLAPTDDHELGEQIDGCFSVLADAERNAALRMPQPAEVESPA